MGRRGRRTLGTGKRSSSSGSSGRPGSVNYRPPGSPSSVPTSVLKTTPEYQIAVSKGISYQEAKAQIAKEQAAKSAASQKEFQRQVAEQTKREAQARAAQTAQLRQARAIAATQGSQIYLSPKFVQLARERLDMRRLAKDVVRTAGKRKKKIKGGVEKYQGETRTTRGLVLGVEGPQDFDQSAADRETRLAELVSGKNQLIRAQRAARTTDILLGLRDDKIVLSDKLPGSKYLQPLVPQSFTDVAIYAIPGAYGIRAAKSGSTIFKSALVVGGKAGGAALASKAGEKTYAVFAGQEPGRVRGAFATAGSSAVEFYLGGKADVTGVLGGKYAIQAIANPKETLQAITERPEIVPAGIIGSGIGLKATKAKFVGVEEIKVDTFAKTKVPSPESFVTLETPDGPIRVRLFEGQENVLNRLVPQKVRGQQEAARLFNEGQSSGRVLVQTSSGESFVAKNVLADLYVSPFKRGLGGYLKQGKSPTVSILEVDKASLQATAPLKGGVFLERTVPSGKIEIAKKIKGTLSTGKKINVQIGSIGGKLQTPVDQIIKNLAEGNKEVSLAGRTSISANVYGINVGTRGFPVLTVLKEGGKRKIIFGKKDLGVKVNPADLSGPVAQPVTASGAKVFDTLLDLTPEEQVRVRSATKAGAILKADKGLPVEDALINLEGLSKSDSRKFSRIVEAETKKEGFTYGSGPTQKQLPKPYANILSGDIDQAFPGLGPAQTEAVVQRIAARARREGIPVEISPKNPRVLQLSSGEKVYEAKPGRITIEDLAPGEEIAPVGVRGITFPDIRSGQSPSLVKFGEGKSIRPGEQFTRKVAASLIVRPATTDPNVPKSLRQAGVLGRADRSAKDIAGMIQVGKGLVEIRKSKGPLARLRGAKAEAEINKVIESYTPEQQAEIFKKISEITGEEFRVPVNLGSQERAISLQESGVVSPSILRQQQGVGSSVFSEKAKSSAPSVSSQSPISLPRPSGSPLRASPAPKISPSLSKIPSASPRPSQALSQALKSPSPSPRPSEIPSPRPSKISSPSPLETGSPSPLPSPSPSPSPPGSPGPSPGPGGSPGTSPGSLPSPFRVASPGGSSQSFKTPSIPPSSLKLRKAARGEFETGFEVFIRRQGKFIKVSSKALPRNAALSLGARAVQKSAAATFKIRPTSKKVRRKRDRFFSRQRELFRAKRTGTETLFIEKNRFRINTPGELAQITIKGLKTRRGA